MDISIVSVSILITGINEGKQVLSFGLVPSGHYS